MESQLRGPVWAVIPARWGSSRLPGKVVAPLAGKPLIHWVVAAVRAAPGIDRVVVATDDERVRAALRGQDDDQDTVRDTEVVLTSSEHESGSDRIGEVVAGTDAAIVVNVQGDEPLLDPAALATLLEALERDPHAGVSTLACPLDAADLDDPNVVKVVRGERGQALYFSRAPVPGVHPRLLRTLPLWRHIGLYAYRRAALDAFLAAGPCALERQEGLEQLRLLEIGVRIAVGTVREHASGVDTPADLQRCERVLARRSGAL